MDLHPPHASRSRFGYVITVAATALVAIAATACGGGSGGGSTATGSTTKITVGSIPIVDVAPIYLGQKQGFFKDAGLELSIQNAQGGAAIVPAVVSGQYQFGFSNTVSLLLATSAGVPLRAVSAGPAATGDPEADYSGILVKSGSTIKSPKDLAGKKVAVNTLNNILSTSINEAVRKDGGDPSGIQYVELPFPDMLQAVSSGDVDAAGEVEPFVAVGKSQGLTDIGSYYAATDPHLLVAMWFTSDNYAMQNPDVVTKFADVMSKSQKYAADHPDETRAVLSDYLKLDAAVQSSLVLPAWPASIDRSNVELLSTLAEQDGTLKSAPDLTQLLP